MMLYKGLEWFHLESFEQDIGNIQGENEAEISENANKKNSVSTVKLYQL